jgi:hypothetical protein
VENISADGTNVLTVENISVDGPNGLPDLGSLVTKFGLVLLDGPIQMEEYYSSEPGNTRFAPPTLYATQKKYIQELIVLERFTNRDAYFTAHKFHPAIECISVVLTNELYPISAAQLRVVAMGEARIAGDAASEEFLQAAEADMGISFNQVTEAHKASLSLGYLTYVTRALGFLILVHSLSRGTPATPHSNQYVMELGYMENQEFVILTKRGKYDHLRYVADDEGDLHPHPILTDEAIEENIQEHSMIQENVTEPQSKDKFGKSGSALTTSVQDILKYGDASTEQEYKLMNLNIQKDIEITNLGITIARMEDDCIQRDIVIAKQATQLNEQSMKITTQDAEVLQLKEKMQQFENMIKAIYDRKVAAAAVQDSTPSSSEAPIKGLPDPDQSPDGSGPLT